MPATSDVVAEFTAISCLSPSVAVEWLQLFDNNLERTINAFFDDPDTLDKKTTFEGQPEKWKGLRHKRRSVAQHSHTYVVPGLIDELGSNRQLTLAEQEEADVQKAINLSTSGTLPAQETGTTTADKPYFGPVRQEHHDTRNWIMTTTSKSTAREIFPNPDPKARKRLDQSPAFLRPSPAGHRLPGLLTMLHAVPAAREALLNRSSLQEDYGQNSEWWDGVPFESPRIVNQGGQEYETTAEEVLHESQRLMAFLDDTERAYGSSEALSTLPGLRDYEEDSVIKEFFNLWNGATFDSDPASPLSQIFNTKGVRVSGTQRQIDDISVWELEINENTFEPGQTLYDTIDSFLWPHWDGSQIEEQVFLDKVADVLVIRVVRGDDVNDGLDMSIPLVWYADRYRQSSQPRVQKMFAAQFAVRNEIEDLDIRKQRASQFRSLNQQGKSVDINNLLASARQHFDKTASYRQEAEEEDNAEMRQDDSKNKAYSPVAEELKALSDRVAAKLQVFEESKREAREKLQELSKLFTEPSEIPEESPHDRYTLRGVCAEPHTVYVQERKDIGHANDLLVNDEAEDSWSWWKLHYEAGSAPFVSSTQVSEFEVLEAARTESPSAILVYASEQAMAVTNQPVPPQLKSFIHSDNLAFRAELSPPSPPDAQTTMTSSPAKRTNTSPQYPSRPSPPRADDASLPSYDDSNYQRVTFSPPSPREKKRDRGYDEYIPASLRDDDDVEMEERGVLRESVEEGGGGGGYRLGGYVPEIEMEDEDENVHDGDDRATGGRGGRR
ncbi:MAG: hypothetical protein Q9220_004542 [cf. Caloplaca sp. 1 TL-2023]